MSCLAPQLSPLCFLHSDVSGLRVVEHVYLPVAACLLLPVGFLLYLGQEVAVFISFGQCSSGMLHADGGTASFGNGGVVVVAKVVDRCVSPAVFTPG